MDKKGRDTSHDQVIGISRITFFVIKKQIKIKKNNCPVHITATTLLILPFPTPTSKGKINLHSSYKKRSNLRLKNF